MTAPDPASRYKALLGIAHQAAQEFREQESARAAKLGGEIHAAGRAVESARKKEEAVTKEVTGWWAEVTLRLTKLRWTTPGPRPKPDPEGQPELLDEYMSQVLPATDKVYSALRRAAWPRKL